MGNNERTPTKSLQELMLDQEYGSIAACPLMNLRTIIYLIRVEDHVDETKQADDARLREGVSDDEFAKLLQGRSGRDLAVETWAE